MGLCEGEVNNSECGMRNWAPLKTTALRAKAPTCLHIFAILPKNSLKYVSHREYGVGEVIDNSDPQMIQVRFGRDLRFLKKDRLARKQLVDL